MNRVRALFRQLLVLGSMVAMTCVELLEKAGIVSRSQFAPQHSVGLVIDFGKGSHGMDSDGGHSVGLIT